MAAEEQGGEAGFTLIELLVVVLIIGILGAIAVPNYLSQQNKARDGAAIQNLASARTAIETFAADSRGEYTGVTMTDLERAEPTLDSSRLTIVSAGQHSYEMQSTSLSGNSFTVSQASNGAITRTCNTSGRGACSSSGNW